MKIEANQIENYVAGCFDGNVVDGAWYGRHIPDGLVSLYTEPEHARIRMACTVGVRLRFATDALQVRIALSFGVRSRENFKSSLLVDGAESQVFGPDEYAPTWEGVIFEQSETAGIRESALSLMPEGLLEALQPDQARDLMAYLMHKSQAPLPSAERTSSH